MISSYDFIIPSTVIVPAVDEAISWIILLTVAIIAIVDSSCHSTVGIIPIVERTVGASILSFMSKSEKSFHSKSRPAECDTFKKRRRNGGVRLSGTHVSLLCKALKR